MIRSESMKPTARVAIALSLATMVWPRWIELVFGIDPDHGSGALEWAIVVVSTVIAIAASVGLVVARSRAE